MIDIYTSLRYAFAEYRHRHHGEDPAKVLMSEEAYIASFPHGISIARAPDTCMGVPLKITDEKGIHIQLCEPEICLFEERNSETIRIERDFNAE